MTQPINIAPDLREALHAHVVQVQFTKADGTKRQMMATLLEQHLPPRPHSEVTSPENRDLFKVWDLQNKAWRSFRSDRLESWTIVS